MGTIMVVDDSRTVRMSMEYLLKNNGYQVFTADDGVDGLKKLGEKTSGGQKPDLIITDVNMPNMGGLEFTKKVKENMTTKFIPVVVLTTESQESMKMEGKKAGAAGWIVKPYQPDQLIGVVKRFVK
jgi:two-component system chemotaxis response regulator CheY